MDVPAHVRAALHAAAAAAAPLEACGALAGVRCPGATLRLTAALPARNEAADPARRFLIGPRAAADLERRAAEEDGAEVVGWYHSQPADARPSATDLAQAFPGVIHLIVDAASGRMRAWTLREDRGAFDEVPIVDTGPRPAARTGVPQPAGQVAVPGHSPTGQDVR